MSSVSAFVDGFVGNMSDAGLDEAIARYKKMMGTADLAMVRANYREMIKALEAEKEKRGLD